MEKRITLPELVSIIANSTNTSNRVSEDFIKALFGTITDALLDDEVVKLKGIGVFKPFDFNKVSFVPDKKLAEAINMPFEQFEPVELGDDTTDDELAAFDEQIVEPQPVVEEPKPEIPETVVPEPVIPVVEPEPVIPVPEPVQPEPEIQEPEPEEEPEPQPVEEPQPIAEPVDELQPAVQQTTEVEDDEPQDESDDDEYHIQKVGRRRFVEGYILGFVSAVALALIVYIGYSMYLSTKIMTITETPTVVEVVPEEAVDTMPEASPAETVKDEQPAVAEQKPAPVVAKTATKPGVVTDTISQRYPTLAKLAKKHYGDSKLYNIIYEANKSKIKNPDNVNIGLVVVIPERPKNK